MADSAAIPSCARASLQGNWTKTNLCIPRGVSIRTLRREGLFFGSTYPGCQLSALKVHMVGVPCIEVRGSRRLNWSSLRCCCLGALVDPENMLPSSLASYVDDALLVVSVIFAYMAGAIPQKRAISGARSNNDQNNVASSSTLYDLSEMRQHRSQLTRGVKSMKNCWMP